MHTTYRSLLFLLFCLPVLAAPLNVRAQFFGAGDQKPETNPFTLRADAAPDTLEQGENGAIHIAFAIAAEHSIYADETRIEIPSEEFPGLTFGTIKTPPTVRKKEPDGKTARVYQGDAVLSVPVYAEATAEPGLRTVPVTVSFRGCSRTGCFLPETRKLTASLTVVPATEPPAPADALPPGFTEIPDGTEPAAVTAGAAKQNPFQKTAARFGLFGVLAAAFLWGIFASLTPCIYPMIPVTVSVIGASGAKTVYRGFFLSLFYVLGMSLTYAAFGVTAAWTGGLFGAYADHPVVRIAVAGIFFLLALSMFDVYYFRMPAWLTTRLGTYSGSGAVGIFLTGAAAGAVVGPCVGPMLVGLLVYIATIGDRLQGFLIMWSFALGMGILFLVIGTFSGAAASLPRSGRWMESVKLFFGILLIGAALYYVAPILPPDVFFLLLGGFLIWVGVFIGGLDPLGAEASRQDRLRKAAGILLLTLGVVYAARFALDRHVVPAGPPVAMRESGQQRGIAWLASETEALALARAENRPLMIDFTAEWCAVCEKLDRNTFRHPDVMAMAETFVPVKIDITDTTDPVAEGLRKKYGVVGLPTILFAGPSGEVLPEQTITEYVPPEEMLARMRRVQSLL